MLQRSWTRLTTAVDRLFPAGLPRIRILIERPIPAGAPVPAAEPADDPQPSLTGEDLARHHLRAARDALARIGGTPASVFTSLRLLLNQLEQGGFRFPARDTDDRAPASIRSIAGHSTNTPHRRPTAVGVAFRGTRRAA